jgi:hypothetical protein
MPHSNKNHVALTRFAFASRRHVGGSNQNTAELRHSGPKTPGIDVVKFFEKTVLTPRQTQGYKPPTPTARPTRFARR